MSLGSAWNNTFKYLGDIPARFYKKLTHSYLVVTSAIVTSD